MHSKKYDTIKAAYDRGNYTKQMVLKLAEKGWITHQEYETIVGID